jgi:hypothetical protein
MKKFKIVFPKNKTAAWVDYSYANQIAVQVSISQEAGFFSLGDEPKVECWCIASDEAVTAIQSSEWKSFIQN